LNKLIIDPNPTVKTHTAAEMGSGLLLNDSELPRVSDIDGSGNSNFTRGKTIDSN